MTNNEYDETLAEMRRGEAIAQMEKERERRAEQRDAEARSRAVQVEIKQRQNPTLSVFENANRSFKKGWDRRGEIQREELKSAQRILKYAEDQDALSVEAREAKSIIDRLLEEK